MAPDECADRLQYLVRQLQRRDAVFTGDGGRASSRDGVQERLDLQFERLLISPFHVLDLDLGATMAPGHPSADHSLTSLIVNRHVGVALKQAEPPHASRRHAAGGQIGDAPAAEHDAGVGDVDAGGQHRNPRGADFFDRPRVKRQDHVQVVDHQVQHHVHVGAPLPERTQAVAFDEARFPDMWTYRPNPRVEPLDVPHLQHAPARSRQLHEFAGLTRRDGNRFFYQDVDTRRQAGLGHRVVRRGRHRHADGVHLFQQRSRVAEDRCTMPLRHEPSAIRIGVHHACQDRASQAGIQAGVVLSQVPDTDDADPDPFHAFSDE